MQNTTVDFIQQTLVHNGHEPVNQRRVTKGNLIQTRIIIEAEYSFGIPARWETWEFIFTEWHMPTCRLGHFISWMDKRVQKRKIA